jgi:Regulator of G protein signaling domain
VYIGVCVCVVCVCVCMCCVCVCVCVCAAATAQCTTLFGVSFFWYIAYTRVFPPHKLTHARTHTSLPTHTHTHTHSHSHSLTLSLCLLHVDLFRLKPGYMAARRKKRGPTIKEILKNDYLSEIFTDFLEASLCQENLLFFRAVEEYNQRVTDESRKDKYNDIVTIFLSSESEFEMDFPEELITMVLDTPEPEPDIFLELQAEAYAVMSRDALPRFLASPIYKDFLGRFGCVVWVCELWWCVLCRCKAVLWCKVVYCVLWWCD